MTIGIFGGSFDPPHLGHKHCIELASRTFDKVIVIPNHQSPHKAYKPAPGAIRLQMVKALCQNLNNVEVDCMELERKGPSYFSETVALLQTRFPKDTINLIIGTDQYEQLGAWHQYTIWRNQLGFFVIPRSGGTISSTKIRNLVQHGLPINNLVPKEIEDTIYAAGLYV